MLDADAAQLAQPRLQSIARNRTTAPSPTKKSGILQRGCATSRCTTSRCVEPLPSVACTQQEGSVKWAVGATPNTRGHAARAVGASPPKTMAHSKMSPNGFSRRVPTLSDPWMACVRTMHHAPCTMHHEGYVHSPGIKKIYSPHPTHLSPAPRAKLGPPGECTYPSHHARRAQVCSLALAG